MTYPACSPRFKIAICDLENALLSGCLLEPNVPKQKALTEEVIGPYRGMREEG
jgi:hypothetical protein